MSAIIGALAGAALSGIASQNAVDSQNKFNERMYQQYLTPQAQAFNLREAGINPAFAMSQIAAGATQTPQQSSPADTSGISALSSSLPSAVLQDQQAAYAKQMARNQEIQNSFEQTKQLLEIQRMSETVSGLKYDNYYKKNSNDLQLSILKQNEQQMYIKTYVDNLMSVGSAWDVATKAMFAKIGQPLEFEKMKQDIAATSAQINYQLKVNKWYDRFSEAQINSLYDNAAAALIQAHSAERNSYVNQYLAPSQRNLNNQNAGYLYQQGLSTQWSRVKDKSLFGITKQSLKLGVQQQSYDVFNKANHYDQPIWNTVGGSAWQFGSNVGDWSSNGFRLIGQGAAAYKRNVQESTKKVRARQKALGNN